jgi:hypothetical protein
MKYLASYLRDILPVHSEQEILRKARDIGTIRHHAHVACRRIVCSFIIMDGIYGYHLMISH